MRTDRDYCIWKCFLGQYKLMYEAVDEFKCDHNIYNWDTTYYDAYRCIFRI